LAEASRRAGADEFSNFGYLRLMQRHEGRGRDPDPGERERQRQRTMSIRLLLVIAALLGILTPMVLKRFF
jgi:hypothetical protein